MLNDLLAKNQSSDKLYVEDVFSTWLYSGTSAPQTITNSINLSGKGGLVWLKSRSGTVYSGYDKHILFDTARTNSVTLSTNNTAADEPGWGNAFFRFQSSGFDFGTSTSTGDQQYLNKSGVSYASWTFRKAPKFFDCITFTGNGASSQSISHALGVTPRFIILKKTSAVQNWRVFAWDGTGYKLAYLNLTNAASSASGFASYVSTTSIDFGAISTNIEAGCNDNGATYVAYLFAHDTTADGVIQCGSVTTDGSGKSSVQNLGWEPQYVLTKGVTYANSNDQWLVADAMRGINKTSDPYLSPNSSSAENFFGTPGPWIDPDAIGFSINGLSANTTYIYLAIRRGPMRVPTDATKVFSPFSYTGSGINNRSFTTNFATDATIWANRDKTIYTQNYVTNKLVGIKRNLDAVSTAVEADTGEGRFGEFTNTQVVLGTTSSGGFDYSGMSSVFYAFRRAPGFFDVVCYTGNNTNGRSVNHGLSVEPELIICKSRSGGVSPWTVYAKPLGITKKLSLNTTGASATQDPFYATPTSSVFYLRDGGYDVNESGYTYVTYLFASCPGVSKVGSYTGTGTTLQINCGFTNGARFVLIKRTDSTGDWYVYDSARGIVAGNDPYLLLNSTAAEVTNTDYVDAYSAGFELSSTAPAALNASGGTYIYLAIA